jgi:transcriptional regulator with XRE-family HTH domain
MISVEESTGFNAVTKHVNQIDRSLGLRLRERRTLRGVSQEELAEKLQIDPKEIDLYEAGGKRISADRLLRIAKALGVRPVYFFGFSDARDGSAGDIDEHPCEGARGYLTLPDQGLRLHRAFVGVKNSILREAIVTLVVEMAKEERRH